MNHSPQYIEFLRNYIELVLKRNKELYEKNSKLARKVTSLERDVAMLTEELDQYIGEKMEQAYMHRHDAFDGQNVDMEQGLPF